MSMKNPVDTNGNKTRNLPAQWNGPAVRCLGATHSSPTHRK